MILGISMYCINQLIEEVQPTMYIADHIKTTISGKVALVDHDVIMY